MYCAHLLAFLPIQIALISYVRDRSAAMQKMAFWTLPLELTSRWKLVFASTSISIAQTCCPFPLVCCAHLLAFLPIQTALISDVRDRSAAMQKMAFWTLPLVELTSRWKLVFASTSISIAQTCCPFPLVCCAHLLAFLPIQTALISDVRDRSAAMQKMAFWTLPLELTSRWKLVFASTSISIAQTCCPFPLVCCAHLLAFLPIQTALISHVRDCSAAMQKLLLFATTTHFTLEACVRIYFHITSPNCSPFPLVCDLKYGVGVRVRCWHFEVVRTE